MKMPLALFKLSAIAVVVALHFAAARTLPAQDRAPRGGRGPASDLSLILGRPTDRSITLSVLSRAACEACVEFGTASRTYPEKTGPCQVPAGAPLEFELTGLKPDTRYYYRLLVRPTDGGEYRPEPEGNFHTQRAPGSIFTFAIQGDSHPERPGKMYAPALYALTLQNVAAHPPDFYVAMGDDFSIERLIGSKTLSQSAVDQVYAYQRGLLGVVGRSSSLFLVNGNHEQAARANLDGTPDNPAILAGRARTRFFPLPAPDAFYTGNTAEFPHLGLPRDYYAWTWGDALFVKTASPAAAATSENIGHRYTMMPR